MISAPNNTTATRQAQRMSLLSKPARCHSVKIALKTNTATTKRDVLASKTQAKHAPKMYSAKVFVPTASAKHWGLYLLVRKQTGSISFASLGSSRHQPPPAVLSPSQHLRTYSATQRGSATTQTTAQTMSSFNASVVGTGKV